MRKPAQKSIARRNSAPAKPAPTRRGSASGHSEAGRPARPGRPLGGAESEEALPVDPELAIEVDDAFESPEDPPIVDEDAEELSEVDIETGSEDRIDDPIRIYLMQMGEIPCSRASRKSRPPSRSSSPVPAFATTCWPAISCCKGR